jgi:hypothetical protein
MRFVASSRAPSGARRLFCTDNFVQLRSFARCWHDVLANIAIFAADYEIGVSFVYA